MPELPETETIARDVHRAVAGTRIVGTVVTRPDVLREITPRALARRTHDKLIQRCWRRAKCVVTELDSGDRIVVQPRFTGALIIDAGQMPPRERRYSALHFLLDDGRALHYRDIRRLGTVSLMSSTRWAAYESALGVEPLDRSFTAAYLSALLRDSNQAVKKLLMDQRRLAGVGNIYASEALWRAGIDPSRAGRTVKPDESKKLQHAVRAVLRAAIRARGTSFRDYRDASGKKGGFSSLLAVYGRGRLPCLRCGARLIDTSAIDGRTTVFCARCQS
ncbi:MAG: bifunctional DNA-formamidopyrimidine glycosylase/DNA-(apurinic or apyrimidinic site) lyase [Gemmatimonadaceae bacterium]